MKNIVLLFSSIAALSVFMLYGIAQPGGGGTPPFVTACSSLSEGDSCTFTDRDGTEVTGTCTNISNPRTRQMELACLNDSTLKQ